MYSKNILSWTNLYTETAVNRETHYVWNYFYCKLPLLNVIFIHVVLFSAKTRNMPITTCIVQIYRLNCYGQIYSWKLLWTKLYMKLFLLWHSTFKVYFYSYSRPNSKRVYYNVYCKNIPPELLWKNLYLETVVKKTIYGIIFNCDLPLLIVIFFHVVLFSAKTQNINITTYIIKINRLNYCGEIYIWKLLWTKLYMELFLLWLCTFKVSFHPSRFSIFCQSTQHIYYNTYCKNTPSKLLWTKL